MAEYMVVAHLGHGMGMANVARTVGKNRLHFARKYVCVEIGVDGKLAFGLLELKA